ncbi:hypothetical protein T05_1349 [Trichinella murrelli]|uniref:Uncharacterized protein n=1 Tax=Trichinella murrelli TaxID=144512 RepID=A0A0V0SWX0_9BILA|nr:hypothetical protein T05_1349 [Trichinella murrelli]
MNVTANTQIKATIGIADGHKANRWYYYGMVCYGMADMESVKKLIEAEVVVGIVIEEAVYVVLFV